MEQQRLFNFCDRDSKARIETKCDSLASMHQQGTL
jgi:hypothetical protein